MLQDLQEEQERLVNDFTSGMAEWLEAFNKYADRLIKNVQELEKALKDIQGS